MSRERSFWDKFWEDENGNLVVVKRPNLPLIVFFASAIIYALWQYNDFGKFFGLVALVSLGVWALLEIFRGDNYFRRLLGVSVLLLTAMVAVI
jgi:hypothetical protein